jgi:DNA-binding GntR family transcriptional regulator
VTTAPHLLPLIRNGERVTVSIPPLPAGSTAFAVVNSIRKALMLGNLRHGDLFVDEDGLATSFGISKRLVHRGLLILVDSGQATREGSTGWQLAEA